jgi:transposase
MEELARRLLVGRKSDGRGVYDEAAKAELVAACGRPGASVSRLARACGINANQLSRWVREHRQRRPGSLAVAAVPGEAFVAVSIDSAHSMAPVASASAVAARICLQARLPNGVVVDLREVDLRQAVDVIDALGRVRCSDSSPP